MTFTRTAQDDGSVDIGDFQSKTQTEFENMAGSTDAQAGSKFEQAATSGDGAGQGYQ